MQLKAAKFAALLSRLRSAFPLMALFALFAALPRTASAATFPARSGDMPDTKITEDSPTVPYYTDGSTKYAFSTWDNLLRAVGIDPESGDSIISGRTIVGGTGASDMLNVTVYNLKDKPSEFCGGVRVKTLGNHDGSNALFAETDKIHYTRFNFVDCVFQKDSWGHWGLGIKDQIGIQVSFDRCKFGTSNGEQCKTFIVRSSSDDYGVDVFVHQCEIWPGYGSFNRFLYSNTGHTGSFGCGDVQITDCLADAYVMPISKGKDAFGGDAELLVARHQITTRLNQISWPTCYANKGFKTATYRDFKYPDGSPFKFFAFRASGDAELPGLYRNGNGEFIGNGLYSEFTWHDTDDSLLTFYYVGVPWHVTYDGNGNTEGTAPVIGTGVNNLSYADASLGGLREDVIIPTGGSLKKGSQVVTSWNTQANGLGTPYDIGETLAGVSSDITLYAQYGAPVPQYSVDGGVTWHDYLAGGWQAVIDAYRATFGADPTYGSGASKSTVVGGTATEQKTELLQIVENGGLATAVFYICSSVSVFG